MNSRDQNQMLHLYHDGELPEAETGALVQSLQQDPTLRSDLALLQRADLAALQAFTSPRRDGPTGSFPLAAVLAGVSLVAASLAVVFWVRAATPPPRNHTEAPVAAAAPAIGVVFSIAIPSGRTVHPFNADTLPADQPDSTTTGGDQVYSEQRLAQLRDMGERIRSAMEAEAALAAMSADEQLDACRVWAMEPRLRPVAFAQLRRLSEAEATREGAARAAADLAAQRELRPWLKSYGMASGTR